MREPMTDAGGCGTRGNVRAAHPGATGTGTDSMDEVDLAGMRTGAAARVGNPVSCSQDASATDRKGSQTSGGADNRFEWLGRAGRQVGDAMDMPWLSADECRVGMSCDGRVTGSCHAARRSMLITVSQRWVAVWAPAS